MVLYVETSALLGWLFGEPSAKDTVDELNSAERVVSSVLTMMETRRALSRAITLSIVTEADAADLRRLSEKEFRSWQFLQMTAEVQERAGRYFPVEPLRTLDAIHLASALQFVELYGSIRVLSHDNRIVDNLAPLGLDGPKPAPSD